MTAPPVAYQPAFLAAPAARRPGPLAWLFGGLTALAATAGAAVLTVLFAAALALAALLAITVGLLAYAAWRVRGSRGLSPQAISARWTGYGWDATGR